MPQAVRSHHCHVLGTATLLDTLCPLSVSVWARNTADHSRGFIVRFICKRCFHRLAFFHTGHLAQKCFFISHALLSWTQKDRPTPGFCSRHPTIKPCLQPPPTRSTLAMLAHLRPPPQTLANPPLATVESISLPGRGSSELP